MSAPPKGLVDQYGRLIDRSVVWNWGTHENPDTTTEEQNFDIASNPQVGAGMAYSDVSHLFVSARGMTDQQNGAYFPAQLMYTTPTLASEDILDFVGWQLDEEFTGGFSETIRSTDNPCKTYGYIVIEYEWYRKDTQPYKGKAFVKQAWARDPSNYRFDVNGKPGLYIDTGYGNWKRVDPSRFQAYAYNPLFNNPYGQSINFTLKPWIETFNKVFGYWRHALEKAGMGSWTGYFPNVWMNNGEIGKKSIAVFEEKMKAIAAGTSSIFPEGANVQNQKLAMEAQAFLDWYNSFCEVVSLIYTGTTTALKESQYGSYSAKESTDVREKSQREKFNAARVSNFWTWQFIPLLVNMNFRPSQIKSYPTLQLIRPELITPTTPQGQDTTRTQEEGGEDEQETIEVHSNEEPQGQELMAELQGETPEPVTPVAIPAGYEDFPRDEPLPDDYRDTIDFARDALREMPVKEYNDVQPEEADFVFTIKKLRNYTTDVNPILRSLKTAIDLTLDADSEKAAWEEYFKLAEVIFRANGIPIDPGIRNDLNISFRQTRQNVLNEGLIQAALQDDAIKGFEIVPNPNVAQHHLDEIAWYGVKIPKTHTELQRGGRLRPPLNFRCVCTLAKVYNEAELTPESDWPTEFPGRTYKYYAQPTAPQTQEANG